MRVPPANLACAVARRGSSPKARWILAAISSTVLFGSLVNAELRASKIRRLDGTELAHDGPDALGIITNRPAVGEIWSIDGVGSASRHGLWKRVDLPSALAASWKA